MDKIAAPAPFIVFDPSVKISVDSGSSFLILLNSFLRISGEVSFFRYFVNFRQVVGRVRIHGGTDDTDISSKSSW